MEQVIRDNKPVKCKGKFNEKGFCKKCGLRQYDDEIKSCPAVLYEYEVQVCPTCKQEVKEKGAGVTKETFLPDHKQFI